LPVTQQVKKLPPFYEHQSYCILGQLKWVQPFSPNFSDIIIIHHELGLNRSVSAYFSDIHFNTKASSLLGSYAMSTSKYQCSEDTKMPIQLQTSVLYLLNNFLEILCEHWQWSPPTHSLIHFNFLSSTIIAQCMGRRPRWEQH
jgi:hypothetical protein